MKISNGSGTLVLRKKNQIYLIFILSWRSFHKNSCGEQEKRVHFGQISDGAPKERNEKDRKQKLGTRWVSLLDQWHSWATWHITTPQTFKEMSWKWRLLFCLPATGYLYGASKHDFFYLRQVPCEALISWNIKRPTLEEPQKLPFWLPTSFRMLSCSIHLQQPGTWLMGRPLAAQW